MSLMALRPHGEERIAGGLLGVAGGEAWQGARGGFEQGGLIAAAMLDLCWSYVEHGFRTSLEVASRYEGVPAPGWLLPVTVVHDDKRAVLSDTLELSIAAGVPRVALSACAAYVELGRHLFAGRPVRDAVRAVRGQCPSSPTSRPPLLSGMAPVDALTAGVWALGQQRRLCDLVASLSHYTEPSVAAAAAGLLGLRDGCAGIPAQWSRRVDTAGECRDVAPFLARSACLDVPAGASGRTQNLVVTS